MRLFPASTFYILPMAYAVYRLIRKMSKRKAVDDQNIPAAKRLAHNVDAMGCLLAAMKTEFDKDLQAMHRRVEDLTNQVKVLRSDKADLKRLYGTVQRQSYINEKYSEELESRMASLEAVISNMLNRNERDGCIDVIMNLRETGNYEMCDLDRLLLEADTEPEDWIDALFEDDDLL